MTNRKYRKKDTGKFLDEVISLKEKYGISYFFLTDSILSNEAVRDLPKLVKEREDARGLRFFSEIKSNLSKEEIKSLREAGFYYMQPGIEAIQDDLLRLMNKGNRAIKHVELLKNARQYQIRFSWNLLFGFPGEKEEWVRETARLIPYLTHLQPPNWGTHIIYQKYSHYHENSEAYDLRLKPLEVYDYLYGFRKKLAQRLAYNYLSENPQEQKGYFNLEERGGAYAEVMAGIMLWHEAYYKKFDCLQMTVYPEYISILDLRQGAKKDSYELRGAKRKLYLYCDTSRKWESILEYMKQDQMSEQEIRRILQQFEEQYLMVSIGEEYLSLAICIAEHL